MRLIVGLDIEGDGLQCGVKISRPEAAVQHQLVAAIVSTFINDRAIEPGSTGDEAFHQEAVGGLDICFQ